MVNKILPLLKKPDLWQRSPAPFWDDGHISKGMLEAHLNPELDAASRPHATIDRSVKWLTSMIPAGGEILDLGCGPGLYTKRLSAAGYRVTGVDFSKRSIDYAKSQDKTTEYRYENYLELDFCCAFDAVTLIYCDYAALTKPEREILLSRVYRALKPGGLFIFDVFTDIHFRLKRERTGWEACKNGGFWSPEPHLCLTATYFYGNTSCDQYIVITETGATEYINWDTAFTKERLTDEVSPFGFIAPKVFDDVCGAPYTGHSETLCMAAAKQP